MLEEWILKVGLLLLIHHYELPVIQRHLPQLQFYVLLKWKNSVLMMQYLNILTLNIIRYSVPNITHAITIRHLLEHSSGLLDHADGDYLKAVLKQPNYVWSRTEQIEMYMRKQFPTFSPAKSFIYSDTGYILLGNIIERITGQSLGLAVRELLHFDSIGLESAYWESLEQPPQIAAPRARQYLGKLDGTHIHASMDTYGGGGLVMSSKQMAIFLEALFEGNIFSSPNTLETMLSMGSHEGAELYRLGIMVNVVNGITLYSHLGFWGSVAYYAPEAKISAAGFVDDRESRETLIRVIESLLSQ